MAIPWVKGIQKTGQLTVFPGPGLRRASAWGDTLFNQILTEFNRLAQTNRFGVRLVRSNNAPTPQGGGANVQVEVSTGSHTYFGATGGPETGQLDVTPGKMKGITHAVLVSQGSGNQLVRAFVFVPINPVLGQGRRGVGKPIKAGLTLHELLHACGLEITDTGHKSSLAGGDIFMTGAVVDAQGNPNDDRYVFGSRTDPDAAGHFTLNASTVALVQSVWGTK